jgi:hypothetical protein
VYLLASDASKREMKIPVDLEVVRIVESMVVPVMTAVGADCVRFEEAMESGDTVMVDSVARASSGEDFALPVIGSEHLENDADALPVSSGLGKEVPLRHIVRAVVGVCRRRFCEVMKARGRSFVLLGACVVARISFGRLLAIWRYRGEKSPDPPFYFHKY